MCEECPKPRMAIDSDRGPRWLVHYDCGRVFEVRELEEKEIEIVKPLLQYPFSYKGSLI